MTVKHNLFEVIIGTIVLFCAIYFFAFSYKKVNTVSRDKYEVLVQFDSADGVDVGSDVKISGVKIGSINSLELDETTYRAKMKLGIDKKVKLSDDSSAKITSTGLLGGKYIDVEPGGNDEILKNGDEIKFTQSSVNLEELLGKFIFSGNSNKPKSESDAVK